MAKTWRTSGQQVAALAAFDDAAKAFMTANDVRNGAIAVTRGTRLVLARGYTWAEPDEQTTEPTSMFRIASCTKPLTRLAIYRLVEAGTMALTDSVQGILQLKAPDGSALPTSPVPADKNTSGYYFNAVDVGHLLRHEGGWGPGGGDAEPSFYKDEEVAQAFGKELPVSRMEIARWAAARPMAFYPGSKSVYSNFGFSLLGLLVEARVGVEYIQHLRASLFAPLGITRPRLGMPLERSRAPGEVGYFPSSPSQKDDLTGGGGQVPIQYGGENNANFGSFGGWVMAAPDYARVLAAYSGTTPPTTTRLRDMAGAPRVTRDGVAGAEHGGGLPGTSTHISLRDDDVGIVAFFNGDKSGNLTWNGSSQFYPDVLHQIASGIGAGSWPGHDLFPSVLTAPVPPGPEKLHVFATDTSKRVRDGAWEQNVAAAKWTGWWAIRSGSAPSGSAVTAVSRRSDQLDAFVVGNDQRIYTAAWRARTLVERWAGWWPILNLKAPLGSQVTAVARSADKLDVFVVGTDGGICTAAWEAGVGTGWRGWWRIGTLVAKAGTPVAAVAPDPNKLDVFVASIDGKTYTAAWAADVASGKWQGWWNILTGAIPAGGAVSAVSRAPTKLDIFHTSTDGGIYTAAWEAGVGTGWRGWWRIGTLVAKAGTPVAAVAPDPNKLDVFVASIDGKTYTAAWAADVASGKWQGWWNILTGAIPAGGAASAVSRAPTKLDIFHTSTDGGIYTAAWEAGVGTGWRGWWRIRDLTSVPGPPVGVVLRKPT